MEFQDLKDTADLAHLNMADEELKNAFPAFGEMLSFFAAMQSANSDTAAFTASITGHTEGMTASSRLVDAAYFRTDIAKPCSNPEQLIEKSGERDGRFIVIPNVL